eukprot:g2702.t1
MSSSLRIVDVPDDPVSRGIIVGRTLKDDILQLFHKWTVACDSKKQSIKNETATMGASATQALAYAAAIWPLICEHAPESAKEIDAIARASSIPRLQIVALNAYDELGLVSSASPEKIESEKAKHFGHCTGVAMKNFSLLGQNWDCPTRQKGIPNTVLLREIQLRESVKSASEAMAYWKIVPRCAGSCFIIQNLSATKETKLPTAMFRFEATPNDWQTAEATEFFAHSNHYLEEKFQDKDYFAESKWTLQRYKRMNQLCTQFFETYDEEVETTALDFIQTSLLDTENVEQGCSIYEHEEYTNGDWETLCSVIFDTKGMQTYVKAGREKQWEAVTFLDKFSENQNSEDFAIFHGNSSCLENASLSVAIVCPLLRDHQQCEKLSLSTSALYGASLNFFFIESALLFSSRDDEEEFDMIAYTEECKTFILKNDIKIVFGTRDMADLVHAALSAWSKSPHKTQLTLFHGPSLESVYCGLDKYVARDVLDPNPIAFAKVDVNVDTETTLPFYPAFLKPRTASCSQLAAKVSNAKEAREFLKLVKDGLPALTRYLPPFLSKHLPEHLHEHISDISSTCLAEAFMDANTHKLTVDGCVTMDGNIILWGITDSNYTKAYPQCFDNCTFPSIFQGTSVEPALIAAYKRVVAKLIKKGFVSGFVDVEFFVKGSTDEERRQLENIRVMEINTRCFPQMAPVYRNVLFGGSQYEALVCLGMGHSPVVPLHNGLIGANFYVNLMFKRDSKSIRADDVIDFEYANRLEEDFEMKVKRDQMLGWTEATEACGLCVAMFYIYAFSREECSRRAREIRKRLCFKRLDLVTF